MSHSSSIFFTATDFRAGKKTQKVFESQKDFNEPSAHELLKAHEQFNKISLNYKPFEL